MTFQVWGYWNHEVQLVSTSPFAGSMYYVEGGEWEIVENSTYVDSSVNIYFIALTMRRKSLFAVVNIIMPIVLMSALNVLVFALPAESGERVSFSVTVLLSTAVFMTMVADNLPKSSEPMSILAYFLLVNLFSSTMMCVVTIFNLRVYFKKDTQTVPPWLKSLIRIIDCRICRLPAKHRNDNEVFPIDINVDTKQLANDDREKEMQRKLSEVINIEEPEMTWQTVASTIDKISISFFIVSFISVSTVFVVTLVKNKGAIGDE